MKNYDSFNDLSGNMNISGYQRRIPFLIKFRIWKGYTISKIGIISFLFMAPFTIGFVSFKALFPPSFNDDDPVASGHIVKTTETNATIGEEMVYAYEYQYEITDGRILAGTGYSTGDTKDDGDEITVQYKKDDPEKSLVADLRNSIFGVELAVFLLFFQGIGTLVLILSIIKTRRRILILKTGALANGRLLARESTKMKIDKQPVYKLTFEFTASDAKIYKVTVNSFRDGRLEDEIYEKLIYDQRNPEKAVLLDQLPPGIKDYFLKTI